MQGSVGVVRCSFQPNRNVRRAGGPYLIKTGLSVTLNAGVTIDDFVQKKALIQFLYKLSRTPEKIGFSDYHGFKELFNDGANDQEITPSEFRLVADVFLEKGLIGKLNTLATLFGKTSSGDLFDEESKKIEVDRLMNGLEEQHSRRVQAVDSWLRWVPCK